MSEASLVDIIGRLRSPAATPGHWAGCAPPNEGGCGMRPSTTPASSRRSTRFGIVHLQGAVTQTVSGGSPLIATLPPAARPDREVYTIVHTFGGTYADLAIAPDGRIGVITPRPPAARDFSFVSLEGITYEPANQLADSPIEINEENWTDTFTPAHPGNGATPAAKVHGQGMPSRVAKQVTKPVRNREAPVTSRA